MKRSKVPLTKTDPLRLQLFRYISGLPFYLKSSGLAFVADISAYTILKPIVGINLAALIAFCAGTSILYTSLRLTRKSKIAKKRSGLALQLCIGIGSLTINLLVLHILDLIVAPTIIGHIGIYSINSTNYVFATKFIAALFGFVWTSAMTMKNIFALNSPRHSQE